MTTGSGFQGDFIANEAPGRCGWLFQHNENVPDVRFCDRPMKPQRSMTVKKLLMMAAIVACASPALADSLVASSNCKYSRVYGYDSCRTTWTRISDPVRNLEQERLDAIALQKEDAKWEAFCKPTFKADEYGVRRASYTKTGCEFGRSE